MKRGTGRGGSSGSQQDRRKEMNAKTKKKKRKKSERCPTTARGLALDQTNNLYLLYSRPAYLRPATDCQPTQVAQLFLAFPRKEILCVPSIRSHDGGKVEGEGEKEGERGGGRGARRNIENLNKFRARS